MTTPERAVPAVALRGSAVLLPAATLLGLATCLVLEARIDDGLLPADSGTGPSWGSGVNAVVLGLLAAVVLRRPGHRGFGLVVGWYGVFWALDGLSEAYYRLGLVTDHPLPGATFAAWFLMRFTALLPVVLAALLVLFPTGRFLDGHWGTVGRTSLGGLLLTCLSYLIVPAAGFGAGQPTPPGVDPDPMTLHLLDPLAPVLPPVLLAAQLVFLLPAMACAVVRYRRARGLDADRMRWLLWGVVAMALSVVGGLVVDWGPLQLLWIFLAFNVPPVAMTVAVLDPRLVPINELLGRTAVYGGLAAIILGVDLAVVAGLTALLGDRLGQPEVVAVVLLLSATLYGPLRSRLWHWVRRGVLGERDQPYDVVAGLAATLETARDGAGQLAAVAEAVATAFGVRFVGIEVDRGGGERLVATHGTRPEHVRTLPITYRDQAVGHLELPARGLRSRLSRRDERLLGDLVRQAATVARTSRLADELQHNRERLVLAREEERRRIRRDLHDGLGPALSGVVFRLESARLLVDADPAAARTQLAASTAQVQEIVADVRRLVHDLRPPALDDRGLVGALCQLAETVRTAELSVEVTADELGPLPAAVEVAAYRIAGEALTNVVRHAAASTCRIRLARGPTELLVEVCDDGVGIPADAPAGIGLRSLTERAAELGGDLSGRPRHRGARLAAASGRNNVTEHEAAPVRVVVVDDHAIVRDGLAALLTALAGVEVVGTAADGREALHVVDRTAPDVVVMDIQMPHLDGVEATRFITRTHPGVRVVMLTMSEEDDTMFSAVRAGASGYLLKGAGAEEVLRAVRSAAAGGMVFGAALAGRIARYLSGGPPTPAAAVAFPELSERERSVLELLAAGRSNDAIARELYVSNKTVRNAVSSVYAKLHAADRAEAIVKAREAGFGRRPSGPG